MMTTAHACTAGAAATTPTGTPFGNVIARQYSGGLDVARIAGKSYGAVVYTGGVSSTAYTSVSGSWGLVVGQSATVSGSVSGETSGWVVQATNICVVNNAGIQLCHVTKAKKDVVYGLSSGDSGAPVYQYDGSRVSIDGILVGGTDGMKPGYPSYVYYQPASWLLPSGWAVAVQ